jgi:hypothetical protein
MSAPVVANRTEERAFGRSVGAVLFIAGAWQYWRGRTIFAAWLIGAGSALMLAGTFSPSVLVWPNRGWRVFGHALGWFNTRVLLTVFFFAVLMPAGWIFRLFGRDPLRRRRSSTEWLEYSGNRRNPKHYEHQF